MSSIRRRPRPWTDAEDATLVRMAEQGATARQIADALGRDISLICSHARKKHIPLRRVRFRTRWTAEMDAYLTRTYPDITAEDIAQEMGLSLPSVYSRAAVLGLKKSEEFISSSRSGRKNLRKYGKNTQFQPGQEPWNKGVKGATGHHPNTREHWFRTGEMSGTAQKNYVPIGTERYSHSRECMIRKVTDDPTIYPAARWRPIHLLVWEAANGPVPEGHICVFKPGRKTNRVEDITLDRIEVITRAEHMRRNSYQNRYPKEIARLIQMKGALNRRVNRMEKKLNDHDR